jgi:hypothetical protein
LLPSRIPPNNKCCQGYREKGTLIHCWWEWKLVQSVWKTIWRLVKKLNIDLPHHPAIPLLGIYLKESNSGYYKGTCTPILLQHYSQEPSYGNSQDAPLPTNALRKCSIYTQWNFIQPEIRMKLCHLQVNGCNWRTSS